MDVILFSRLGNSWNSVCYKDVSIFEIKYLPLKSSSVLDMDSRSEEISEHSSDPCDSTSYPHKTNKMCKAKEYENKCQPGESLTFHNAVIPTSEGPDSTNRNEDASSDSQNALEYTSNNGDSSVNEELQMNTNFQIASRLPGKSDFRECV